MLKSKPIHKESIPRALTKAERYRLLNEPLEAESICRDILEIDPENQDALITLILSLTDQFHKGVYSKEASTLLMKLKDEYNREYYKGIILERRGKSALMRNHTGSHHDVYEWLEEAMKAYENAERLSSPENDDAILRWNTCTRIINKNKLIPRPPESWDKLNLPME